MSANHCDHCVPNSGHITRMVLALLWSQRDSNNSSAIFLKLLLTLKALDSLVLPGTLPAARFEFVIVIT